MHEVEMTVEDVIEVESGGAVNVVARADDGTALLLTYPSDPAIEVGATLTVSVAVG